MTGSKTQIWTREEIQSLLIEELSTKNVTTIAIEDVLITNVHEEPGERALKSLDELTAGINRYRGKWIVAGDFNAKHTLWGSSRSSPRGEELLDWAISHGLELAEGDYAVPSFDCNRDTGHMDLTWSRGINVEEWKIKGDEETLSEHRYIEWRAEMGKPTQEKGVKLEEIETNIGQAVTHEVIEEQAASLQKAIQAAGRLVKRKTIMVKIGNELWDGQCAEHKRAVTALKRRIRRSTDNQQIVNEYNERKREFRKIIREKKTEHDSQAINNLIETNSWDGIWEAIRRMGIRRGEVVAMPKDATL
ncbi:uncharacterized protein LOC143205584 [Rhynchophorus ferrugineus]|uniref:uncharacterized protein LOC143205584 n=1 Tax=Rhynchophorus ferrugineus TaxID=354439 RepID=UPI003FCD8CF2